MVRIQAGALVAPLAVAGALLVAGCGADDRRPAPEGPPAVTDGGTASAPDVAGADDLCRRYQRTRPAGVDEVRIRVPGSPSVTCVVR
ncbi:MAG: hypothetical protein F2817_17670 [Actinobacteria bacterium]|nr:hypothetical protein [Actinomycetota bacterium]